jgi:hypothetical protein
MIAAILWLHDGLFDARIGMPHVDSTHPQVKGAAESWGFLRHAGSHGCLVTEDLAGRGTSLTTAGNFPLSAPLPQARTSPEPPYSCSSPRSRTNLGSTRGSSNDANLGVFPTRSRTEKP